MRTPILAAADGIVQRSGWLDSGAGNGVILSHEGGWQTRYFHMESADLPVIDGEQVVAGQLIGHVGSTGRSTGPHLHFEIVFGPVRMDPEDGFTYVGREPGTGLPENDLPSDEPSAIAPSAGETIDSPPDVPVDPGSASDIATLSDPRSNIAEVQRELLRISADASAEAAALEVRRLEQQHHDGTATLVFIGGAMLVAFGLVLLWATRPRWPAKAPSAAARSA
jgi:murein DD-endopeptidase MepM/ murein hydrolase activator NlpD